MQNYYNPEKLNFLTAGMPFATKGSYKEAFVILKNNNLDGMELEFVHGVRISEQSKEIIKENNKNLIFTAHAPFYINLNSNEAEKTDASVQRIIETLQVANEVEAYSITFHAAFYMGKEKEEVYKQVRNQIQKIIKAFPDNKVWIRPETTGKSTQWGDFEEIIKLSKEFYSVLPCIDFSHIHARTTGKYNTYDEFSYILEKISKELGSKAIENFHAHLAGIEYTLKGERKHLNLENSDMNYKDLLKVLKVFGVKGAIVCESPNIEEDTMLIKNYYNSL